MVPDVHWHVVISPKGVSVVSTYLIWFTVGDSTEVYSYSKCVGALDTTIIRPLPPFSCQPKFIFINFDEGIQISPCIFGTLGVSNVYFYVSLVVVLRINVIISVRYIP